jgi:hypothetical protein
MDRLGVVLQLRQQVQQRIGAGMASPPRPRSKTLFLLDQLGSTTAIRAINPLADELSSLDGVWPSTHFFPHAQVGYRDGEQRKYHFATTAKIECLIIRYEK